MARKGTATKKGQSVSSKSKKPSVVAKGKKKVSYGVSNEPRSPDPPTSDSGESVQLLEIHKGSPERLEFPRSTKGKRKTADPSASTAKRRKVINISDGFASANSPAAPRQPSLPRRSHINTEAKVAETKAPPSQCRKSKRSMERKYYEFSDDSEISGCTGSPVNTQLLCGSNRQPSRSRRSQIERDSDSHVFTDSQAALTPQPSLPHRSHSNTEARVTKRVFTPQSPKSRRSIEREYYDFSGNIQGSESSQNTGGAGSPANAQLPCGSRRRLVDARAQPTKKSVVEDTAPKRSADDISTNTPMPDDTSSNCGGSEAAHLPARTQQPWTSRREPSLEIADSEQSYPSQNVPITQETQASSVTLIMSPSSTRPDLPKPLDDWEDLDIVNVTGAGSKPLRLRALCRRPDGTEKSIWVDDLVEHCPRKVALFFTTVATELFQRQVA